MPTRSEVLRARRKAVGGRRPRCRKGKSCSAACINRNKYCLVDAPTPVAGALPRAVRAIQSRRERLKPREKREVLQKRREYVKGKLTERAELNKKRRAFIVKRRVLLRGIRNAMLNGDPQKVRELENKLRNLQFDGLGLKVRGVGSVDELELRRKVSRVGRRMLEMKSKMTKYAQEGAKGSYDKLEKKYLRLQEGLFRYAGIRGSLAKGEVWRNSRTTRSNRRSANLLSVYDRLVSEARQAARDNDLGKYRQIERSLLKVSARMQKDSDVGQRREALIKGLIWKDIKVPKALEKIHKGMEEALDAGDLNRYLKLENKFFNVKDKYLKTGNYYKRSNNLNSLSGFSTGSVVRGGTLSDYLDKLRLNTMREAKGKNRREYNKLEEKLLKLDPKEVKGRIWKDQVEGRVQKFVAKTRNDMIMAAENKNRREYNRLERILMRLDPTIKKGEVWRRSLTGRYLPELNRLLVEAAEKGDRRRYNKLERVLFRISGSGGEKGKIWREARVGSTIEKLMEEMERAVKNGDRDRYNRLEERFFRIKSKAPRTPSILNSDLNYVSSRGQLWREIERSIPLQGLESTLDKGKREGVSRIKIRGGVDAYQVTSRVLGNDLKVYVTPNDSTSFTVNGSHTAAEDLPRRERIAIIREVSRQYDEIFKSMDEGTVFMVTAAEGDGREDMRERGYTGRGFSDPDDDGRMFGKVGRNGRIIPIDEDEYDYVRRGGDDEDWDDED